MNHHLIPGEAGDIEAIVEAIVEPAGEDKRGVVLCHPHPLYGGSMHDGVLAAVAAGFAAAGITTLRFNFRGVGRSAGTHDQGAGEARDVTTVASWLCENYAPNGIFLGGYSFGAGMAYRCAGSVVPLSVVLVAPPVQMIRDLPAPAAPTLVLLGRDDEIVDCHAAGQCFETAENAEIRVLDGCDHFFMAGVNDITASVTEFINGT